MFDAAKPITITLVGPFTVTDGRQNNITPPGQRCCAMLAMLALSKSGRRSRGWLMAHLWSEKDPAKARGSLRTEINRLRKHFMDAIGQDPILTMGQDVGLDLDLATIDLDASTHPNGVQLLEGFNSPDPEFEAWLRDVGTHWENKWADDARQRKSRVSTSKEPEPDLSALSPKLVVPTIHLKQFEAIDVDPQAEVYAKALTMEVSHLFSLMADSYTLFDDDAVQKKTAEFVLSGKVRQVEQTRVQVMLVYQADGTIIWSETINTKADHDIESLRGVGRIVVEEVQSVLTDSAGRLADSDVPYDAYEAFARARALEARGGRRRLIPSIKLYRKSLGLAPVFVAAKIGLAFRLLDGLRNGWLRYEDNHLAETAEIVAELRLIAPDDLWGRMLEAFYLCANSDILGGLRIMEGLVAEHPESSEMNACLGAILDYSGRYVEGQNHHRFALTLSHYPPAWVHTNLALSLMMSGDMKEAETIALSIVAREPDNLRALIVKAVAEVVSGRMDEARQTASSIKSHDPSFEAKNWRAAAFFLNRADHRRIGQLLSQAGL